MCEIGGVTLRISYGADTKTIGQCCEPEGPHVIGLSGTVRVLVATKPVDLARALRDWLRWCANRYRPIHSRAPSTCPGEARRSGEADLLERHGGTVGNFVREAVMMERGKSSRGDRRKNF